MNKNVKKLGMSVVVGVAVTVAGARAGASSCSCSSSVDTAGGVAQRVSTQNPANPVNVAIERSIERALGAMDRMELVHAAESDLFRYPAVFTEYGYSQMNDERDNGMDAVTQTITVGTDFMTLGDLFVGAMVSYSTVNADNEALVDDNGDVVSLTLYASKAIADNMFAGLSLSYSDDDSDLGSDTDTYAVAPYVSYVVNLDNIRLSISPTYAFSFSETDSPVGGDQSSRGELLLVTRASTMVSEDVSVYAGATMHQVLHSHLLDAEDGQDHNWIGTSVGMDWMLNEKVSLGASVGYDVLNKNYDNNLNARLALTCQF